MGSDAQAGAGHTAENDRQQENRLFKPPVRQGAANGSDEGNQNGGKGAGIAPVTQIHIFVDAGGTCQGVEVNGDQSGNQQRKGRVTDIVKDPVLFQGRQLEFFFYSLSLSFCWGICSGNIPYYISSYAICKP